MVDLPLELWVGEIWLRLYAGAVVRSALMCKSMWTMYQTKCRALVLENHSFECWYLVDKHIQHLPRGLLRLEVGCCSGLTAASVPQLPPALVHLDFGSWSEVSHKCIPHLPRGLTFMGLAFMQNVDKGAPGLPLGIEHLARTPPPPLPPHMYVYDLAFPPCNYQPSSRCCYPTQPHDLRYYGCFATPACKEYQRIRPMYRCGLCTRPEVKTDDAEDS